MPMALETPMARITAKIFIATGNQFRITSTIKVASIRPIIPPKRDSMVDSVRKWSKISFLVAPKALRIPTSLVRSVTVAYMIFIIPTPPTISEIDPMAIKNKFNIAKI
jgi:hypothetical protein